MRELFVGLEEMVDPDEAPEGYYAIEAPPSTNRCSLCDWRKDCSGFVIRCHPHQDAVGELSVPARKDGHAVVFKKKESEQIKLAF